MEYIFDFEQARILIFHGSMNYPRFIEVPPTKGAAATVKNLRYENFQASKSTWLLILQPYIVNGVEKPEHLIKRKASSIAGLYAAINGFNMTYDRVFDFSSAMSGEVTCSSPAFINPRAFPVPNLSHDQLDNIHQVGKVIDQLQVKDKQRVELALHWFESGLRSIGLDGFIKHWIALETLGMPDGTNIKPLNEHLSSIYNLPLKEAQEKFGIGKVLNLRSRIVHNGEDLSIHQDLSQYMEALFLDILLSCLNISPAKRALSIINAPDFDIKKLTHC